MIGVPQEDEDFKDFCRRNELSDWEPYFHPSSEELIERVLEEIKESDVVLDIGAGNLYFAQKVALKAEKVYALEVNPYLVARGLERIGFRIPRNLLVICANALDFPFPSGITVATLLMRHCQHFRLYFQKLREAGCHFLITNARWKTDFERIDLNSPRVPYKDLEEGWYACSCGSVGYKGEGNLPQFPAVEVKDCPNCFNF